MLRSLVVAGALFLLAGCGATGPKSANQFSVAAGTLARQEPKLARKLAKRPFSLFRYRNRAFVDEICSRYRAEIPSMPMVHAHGDAHLEQYAVAAEGRGLADFDASAVGPPIVDLARFATSLVLARPGERAGARAAIDALLEGYVRALDDPMVVAPEPAVAARLRSHFAPTTVEWLDRAEKLILPMSPADGDAYGVGWAEFVAKLREKDPSLDPAFFQIKVGGHLDMGVGSAQVEKFLVRIEGPTPAPEDDLMMEAKELAPGSLGSCMRGADLDAVRVITGQTQISNAPQRFLGAVTIRGRSFYSHTWLVHYTELSIVDVKSAAELAELAFDVGLQLGRGHAKLSDPTQVPAQRARLRLAVGTVRNGLASAAEELADAVTQAWHRYVAEVTPLLPP